MTTPLIGRPLDRIDGRLKVTGRAEYTADIHLPNMAYGILVGSTIARGRIRVLDTRVAAAAPGVRMVLTHLTMPKLHPLGFYMEKAGTAGQTHLPLQDEHIYYAGQYIALIVADTLEQGQFAATLLQISYEEKQPLMPGSPGLTVHPLKNSLDATRGEIARGMAEAEISIDAQYTTPIEYHNAMELGATTASWEGEQLTFYNATQWVFGDRNGISTALGLAPEQVRVISRFVGGGFGSKALTWPHMLLAPVAARMVGRPVKIVLTRQQMYSGMGHRPHTEQQIRLGARRDGLLTALQHTGISTTSPFDEFIETFTNITRSVYPCPNAHFSQRMVRVNMSTPTPMRAPGEATGMFALESAMDELANKLKLDPLELRLRNYAEVDPDHGLPWSSKALRECYRQGAERFGWSRRSLEPRSMCNGRNLVGWGMATAMYPTYHSPSAARVRLLREGSIEVEAGTQDIGTGTYTVLAQLAAETLGLPIERISVALGDTRLPPTSVAGGSRTVASLGPSVVAAAREVRAKIIQLAINDERSALFHAHVEEIIVEGGCLFLKQNAERSDTYEDILQRNALPQLEVYRETIPPENTEQDKQRIFSGLDAMQMAVTSSYSMHAFGAHFVEVQVDPDLGTIRVTRFIGAFGAGRIINEKMARNQMMGGIILGLGMALLEEAQIDPLLGRIMNANLAEYHVPVHADVPNIETFFVEENDPHVNAIGAKGVGELGGVGVAGAVANAVFHATGKRVRDLPITLDKLL